MARTAGTVTPDHGRIPLLDLADYRAGRPGALQAVADTIARTCEDTGFMLLANHGIPQPLIDQVFDQASAFFDHGLEFKLGAKVLSAKAQGNKAVVEIEGQDSLTADRVLVAVGRKPNTDGLNVEGIGLELDKRGFIPVDSHFRTKVPGVYAIGDVIGGAMLAHKAEEEGIACVEAVATGTGHVNYGAIPGVAYTEPEIASVGKTEEQLKDEGVQYKKGTFPFTANGRARALGHTDGKVKVLADAETDRLLGVHIIGSRAGDLIAEAVAAIEFGASAEDVARTSHAHPTLAEAFKEAALAVEGRAIHI